MEMGMGLLIILEDLEYHASQLEDKICVFLQGKATTALSHLYAYNHMT